MRGLILGAAALATTGTLALSAPVEREGRANMRRAALNEMEATRFDPALIDVLRDWTPSQALTRDGLEGNVVMFVTLDVAQPGSMIINSSIKRLQREFGDKGLVVVGVHPDTGWDEMVRHLSAGMIDFPVARDSYGRFREAIMADESPDVYLLDRAGQLRYADITNASMRDAVAELIGETPEHARGEAQRRTTREGRIAAGLESDPDAQPQPRTQASPEREGDDEPRGITIPAAMYDKADWPAHNRRLSAQNYQGKPMPAQLGNEQWLSEKVDTQGKVIVLDFWATWCGPCKRAAPTLDRLQKANRDELAVLAISGSGEDAGVVKKYLRRNQHAYAYLHDDKQTLSNAFGVRGIPHTVVLSTDGVVRWQGNPLSGDFVKAVNQVIKQDPVVQARKRGQTIAYESPEGEADSPSTELAWPEHNRGKIYAERDVQGETLDNPLAGLRWIGGSTRPDTEGKVVVIDFWATWCGPCKRFSPRLDAMQKKFADDVVAIGVAGQNDTIQAVEAYLETVDHSYVNAYDSNQRLYKRLGVQGIPHVLILSSDGVVRWQGFPGGDEFESILEQVVIADRARRADD